MNYLAVLLLLLLQAPQSAPSSSAEIPSNPGVYCRRGDGSWVVLQKAIFLQSQSKGLELFVETGGWSNLGIEAVCPGAKSAVRLSDSRPVFYVRQPVSMDSITLIQFSKKKDRRTFHKSTADTTVENKGGFKKEVIRKTTAAFFSEGIFTITPQFDLKPGEYLLTLDGDGTLSYDFGIDR